MTSLLNLERYPDPAGPETAPAPLAPEPGREVTEETVEFEIVLGHRQVASTSLVAIVLLAVVSGVSYLIGKSMASKAAPVPLALSTPAPTMSEPAPQVPAPQVPAPKLPAPIPQGQAQPKPAAPLFANALPGQVYLQVGVIQKGPAGIWAEGLRTHGLEAFVAPSPDGLWRVLIGPLPDPKAYERAKEVLDVVGLATFGRRYPTQ
jgi:cell division septation protein DedD